MAESLGASASVIAVLQLTTTVVKYFNGVKEAKTERSLIFNEIINTRGVLETFKDLAESEQWGGVWTLTVTSLNSPGGPLDQFKRLLERLVAKLKPTSDRPEFVTKLVWPFEKAEVTEILNSIERLKFHFGLALQNDHVGLSRALKEDTKELKTEVEEIRKGVSNIQIYQDTQENLRRNEARQDVLAWLSPLNFSSSQNDIFSRRQPGTGSWILEDHTYQNWLAAKKTLWCTGIPGGSKTVTASIIIDSLKPYTERNYYGLAYIYCNYKESAEQTAVNLLASLVQQLTHQSQVLPDTITELHQTHIKERTRPSLSELSTVFQALLNNFPEVFVIIDALDECVDTTITHTRSSLLGELRKVHSRIHLLITSRLGIELDLLEPLRLEIRATSSDITTYLDARIKTETRLKSMIGKDVSLHSEIIATIVEKSQGMFLLPKLHMDSLSKKTNRKALRSALGKLPKEIDQTYDEAMQRIRNQEEGETDLALRTLMWITFARRPLTSLELRYALAVESSQKSLDEEALVDEDIIESVCAGLVIVDEESSIIRLVHYTAQEYFKYSKFFPDADSEIAKTCLAYLSLTDYEQGPRYVDHELEEEEEEEEEEKNGRIVEGFLNSNPFFDYAACIWGDHARGYERQLSNSITDFLLDDVKTSVAGYHLLSCLDKVSYEHDANSMIIAAFFGLKDTISTLLETGVNVDVTCRTGQRALHWATVGGSNAVIQLLLDNGSDIEAEDDACRRPLHWVTMGGRESAVRIFLSYGAHINSRDEGGRTPLHFALKHDKEDLARLLLSNGANVEARDQNGRTPLSWAVRNRCDRSIIKMLLEKGADVNALEKNGDTPLFHAAINGQDDVATLLIDNGADLPVVRSRWRKWLHFAVWASDYEIVQRLLERGADVTARTGSFLKLDHMKVEGKGETALELAIRCREREHSDMSEYDKIIRVLEEKENELREKTPENT